MRAGLIGCGKIAQFHVDVLKSIGVELAALSYRSDLGKAKAFCDKNSIPSLYPDWRKMVEKESPDLLWVMADWESIDGMLLPVLELRIPVFFEKPVALSSKRLEEALARYPAQSGCVQVGYNRRFYNIVATLKEELGRKSIINVEVFIPESVASGDKKMAEYKVYQNSSHLVDLLLYILGDDKPEVKYVHRLGRGNGVTPGFIAGLETESGIPVYLSSVYNSPLNSAIRIYTDDSYIYELKPIEKLSIYKGFEVLEPSPGQPIRLYNPKVERETYEPADKFKPGFLRQAEAFKTKTVKGNNNDLPNLTSSLEMTRLIEKIMH